MAASAAADVSKLHLQQHYKFIECHENLNIFKAHTSSLAHSRSFYN